MASVVLICIFFLNDEPIVLETKHNNPNMHMDYKSNLHNLPQQFLPSLLYYMEVLGQK